MATTTNNGWTIPADTDLVRNGALAIRTLGNAIDSSLGKATYTNYSPTVPSTGWTLGTGNSTSGNYCQLGKTVFFDGIVQFGTSATTGSGTFAIDLPISASTNTTEWAGNGLFYDSSDSAYYPLTVRITGTKLEFYFAQMRTSTPTAFLNLNAFTTANRPVQVGTGDQVVWTVTYQAA